VTAGDVRTGDIIAIVVVIVVILLCCGACGTYRYRRQSTVIV
jgi:hypothetical protein